MRAKLVLPLCAGTLVVSLASCGSAHRGPGRRPEPTSEPPPSASATSASAVSSTTGVAPKGPPALADLRAILRPHAARRFDAAARQRGCPNDQTLGEYLAMLVRNGEDGDGAPLHHLKGTCSDFPAAASLTPVDPPHHDAYWYCRIEAFNSDARLESPWRYELRLRVRRSDHAPDLLNLSCPGTP